MDQSPNAGFVPEMTEAFSAALDWWREAGIDGDFTEEPIRWLKPPEDHPQDDRARRQTAAPPAEPPPAKPTLDRDGWPRDLATFAAWWLSDPALDDGRTGGRVPPRGQRDADLMVIVPDPERDDRESLLAGPQGRLLDAILKATGTAPDRVYLASVLPRHMPMADWPALAEKGFGDLLRHHVFLARPRRLVVLGNNILPLLGNDPAHNPAVLTTFNHEDMTIPLLAGRSLAALLERPRWKAGLWQGWLDWTSA